MATRLRLLERTGEVRQRALRLALAFKAQGQVQPRERMSRFGPHRRRIGGERGFGSPQASRARAR